MKSSSRFRGLTPSAFVLLAPASQVPAQYSQVVNDAGEFEHWLERAQVLRGQAYLNDGAVDRSHITDDGRLLSPWDRKSWHVIARDGDDACATMRFTFHRTPVMPELLALGNSGLLSSPAGDRSRRAIESFQTACFWAGDVFGEVGGWAASASRRGSRKSAAVALSAWPVCRSQGRVRAISTVTERNQSIGILTRIAAAPLRDAAGELPSWYDASYLCRMHLSMFTTWDIREEFESDTLDLAELLYAAPLFTTGAFNNGAPKKEEMTAHAHEYSSRDGVFV